MVACLCFSTFTVLAVKNIQLPAPGRQNKKNKITGFMEQRQTASFSYQVGV